jgi:tetratricopeptide (TPR) repeat protein
MNPRIGTLFGVAVLAVCASGISAATDVASTVRDADACVSERKFDCAQALYERAQAEGMRFETDLPHARNLATAYLNSTHPDLAKAIPWLQVAVKLDPQADSLRAQLASSLVRSGNLDAAIDHYRLLSESHPTSTEYGIQLATVLRQAGKSDAALQFLQASTEKFPSLVAFRVEYARLLNFTKQYPEARKQFLAALALEPQNLIAQVGLAKATSYEGDQETAIEMYDRILQRHPGSYDAIVGKAFSLLWSGHAAQAGVLLRQASARNPDDPEVREALSTLPHSADSPAAVPEDRTRRLDNPRRVAQRRTPNSETPESNATPSLDRTIPSRTEQSLPQPEQPHRYGVAAALIGFCLMLAPFVFGRRRSCLIQSRMDETETLSSEQAPDCNVERGSEDCSYVLEVALGSTAAAEVITLTPENDSVRPAPSFDQRPATARQASVEDSMENSIADSTLPVSAEAGEPGGEIVEQEAHELLLESYQPLEATQESPEKAQLKLLLRMATSFGSHMEEDANQSSESGWGGLDGVGDAMCFGLTAPLQGIDSKGRGQANPLQH